MFSALVDRETGEARRCAFARNNIFDASQCWSRLGMTSTLKHHTGCVNHLSFSPSGDLLCSGSDDEVVCVWDVFSQKLRTSLETGHTANIFCSKFMPESGDRIVATCAGDNQVRVHDMERKVTAYISTIHQGRVKKLVTEAGNPALLMSGSEDSSVRQHDLRQARSLAVLHAVEHGVLLEINSICSPRLRPWLLAVGASDDQLRVYDRRMVGVRTGALQCVQRCSPAGSEPQFRADCITGVAFSDEGDEVLANYLGDHIYLFPVTSSACQPHQIGGRHRDAPEGEVPTKRRRSHSPMQEEPPSPLGWSGPRHDRPFESSPQGERMRVAQSPPIDAGEGEAEDGSELPQQRSHGLASVLVLLENDELFVPTGRRRGLAMALVGRSMMLLSQGQLVEAHRYATRAVLVAPTLAYALHQLACCLEARGDLEGALKFANDGLRYANAIMQMELQGLQERLQRALHADAAASQEAVQAHDPSLATAGEAAGARDLPPALRERLVLRGILPPEALQASDSGEEEIVCDCNPERVCPGDPREGSGASPPSADDDARDMRPTDAAHGHGAGALPHGLELNENIFVFRGAGNGRDAVTAGDDRAASPAAAAPPLASPIAREAPPASPSLRSAEAQAASFTERPPASFTTMCISRPVALDESPRVDTEATNAAPGAAEGAEDRSQPHASAAEREALPPWLRSEVAAMRGGSFTARHPASFTKMGISRPVHVEHDASGSRDRSEAEASSSIDQGEPEEDAELGSHDISDAEDERLSPALTGNLGHQRLRPRAAGGPRWGRGGGRRDIPSEPSSNSSREESGDDSEDDGSEESFFRSESDDERHEGYDWGPYGPGGADRAGAWESSSSDGAASSSSSSSDSDSSEESDLEQRSEQLQLGNLLMAGEAPRAPTPGKATWRMRYRGHCAVKTIKDVSFVGPGGKLVAAGSDDGRMFLWERQTGKLVAALRGDRHVVNCIAGHPTQPILASCGIDNSVKLWEPCARKAAAVPGSSGGLRPRRLARMLALNEMLRHMHTERLVGFQPFSAKHARLLINRMQAETGSSP